MLIDSCVKKKQLLNPLFLQVSDVPEAHFVPGSRANHTLGQRHIASSVSRSCA